ncbi:MAG: glycosyltransferase [Methanogenium sp.]|jgi:hypothetical protein
MNIKDFATCTVAYNDEKMIGGMIKGVEDLHNLVIISKPWRGTHLSFDKTGEIAERLGAEVIYQDFQNEGEERNFGMEYLEKKGFKHVFIIDTDEYYTKENIYKMMKYVEEHPMKTCRNKNDKVYWKSWKYYFQHCSCLSYMKSNSRFSGKRTPKDKIVDCFPHEIEMHHFSFEKTTEEMLEKIKTREYSVMSEKWLQKYWLNWQPGDDYKDFKIVQTTSIPEEILGRYIKSINLLY